MQITIELPDTITFNVGGESFSVAADEVPPDRWTALLMYGRRKLNDAYNSRAKTARDEGKPKPDPRGVFDAFLDGSLFEGSRGGHRKDPITREAESLAVEAAVRAGIAKTRKDARDLKLDGIIARLADVTGTGTEAVRTALWDKAAKVVEARNVDGIFGDL